MLKFLIYFTVSLSLLCGFQAAATPLMERTIQSGSNSGKKLIDLVDAYTIPGLSGGSRVHIPALAVEQAFAFFDRYAGTTRSYNYRGVHPVAGRPGFEYLGGVSSATGPTIGNQRLMVIFDLNLHSSLKRLHVINIETGDIDSFVAAHGLESDCGSRRPGYACNFVSDQESRATPLGFFMANRLYNSESHGGAITLVGLEKSSSGFSGNDVPTEVVIHSAPYVRESSAGRSNGCPAVSEANIGWFRQNVKDGALFYFFHSSLDYTGREPSVSGLQTSVAPSPAASDVDSDSVTSDADDDN